ncbi:MAG TPA: hypothetical protein VKH81_25135 [Candidatus Angelobacter sp.]|nr:hypothetical protein [Candidatus Angelobacter sp.]
MTGLSEEERGFRTIRLWCLPAGALRVNLRRKIESVQAGTLVAAFQISEKPMMKAMNNQKHCQGDGTRRDCISFLVISWRGNLSALIDVPTNYLCLQGNSGVCLFISEADSSYITGEVLTLLDAETSAA